MGKAFKDMEVVRVAAMAMLADTQENSTEGGCKGEDARAAGQEAAASSTPVASGAAATADTAAAAADPLTRCLPVVAAAEGTYAAALALGLGGEVKGAMCKVFEQRREKRHVQR